MILVPIDFSPHSEAVLSWAVKLARGLGEPLHVLHVVHDPASKPGYYAGAGGDEPIERIEEAAARMMDEFLDRMRATHPEIAAFEALESSLVIGLPVTRILETAGRLGATMIVMGSQGRTGLSHLLLGSKAEKVVQLSPIPVTIVKKAP